MPAKRLLVIGQERAGTTLLVSYLRSGEEVVVVHAEPISVTRVVATPVDEIKTVLKTAEETHPKAKYVGCRVTPEQLIHHKINLSELTESLDINKIVVVSRSRALDLVVSRKVAEQTGRYYTEEPAQLKETEKVRVTTHDIESFVEKSVKQWETIVEEWPVNIVKHFIQYESLAEEPQATVLELWKNLDCQQLGNVRTAMVRQHPVNSMEKIVNRKELATSAINATIDIPQIFKTAGLMDTEHIVIKNPTTSSTSSSADPFYVLAALSAQVVFFHCFDAILKEQIFHLPSFSYVEALSVIQAACIACVALLDCRLRSSSLSGTFTMKAPFWVYGLLGLLMSGSYILTNKSILHLDYLTQVVFKSSKLLWVMVARIIFLRSAKKPGIYQWIGAVLIVAGLGFMSTGVSKGKRDYWGLGYITAALVCDAGVFIVEEGLAFGRYNAAKQEVILLMQVLAIIPAIIYFYLSSTYPAFVVFLSLNPSFLLLVVGSSACSYFGTSAVLQVIMSHGGSTAALITSFRKLSTILFSYLLFPKPFTLMHFIGTTLIVVGANANLMSRSKEKS